MGPAGLVGMLMAHSMDLTASLQASLLEIAEERIAYLKEGTGCWPTASSTHSVSAGDVR